MALSCHDGDTSAEPSMDTRPRMRFRIEPMRVEHIPVVSAIEKKCFAQPWPQNAYRREIQSNKMAHYFVARKYDPGVPIPEPEPPTTSPAPSENGLLGR